MKTLWIKSLVLAATLAVQSYALFGIGAHWDPAPGLEVKADNAVIATGAVTGRSVALNEMGFTGAQGFGGKVWLDFLPLVDLELAGNLQFGYYDVALTSSGTSLPVQFDLGIPGLEGKPFFARLYGDAAVLYPFFKFPPLIKVIRIYAGGGLSYGAATPIVSPGFAKAALDKARAAGNYNPDTDSDNSRAAGIIVDAIQNADFEKGVGGFLQIGARVKPPFIPVAVYADLKYHVLGFNPDHVEGNGLNFELGAALAF